MVVRTGLGGHYLSGPEHQSSWPTVMEMRVDRSFIKLRYML
jgi:hypothetical protein